MKSLRPALLLAALPAILLWLVPASAGALLCDRTAILRGEWWRLWTGHWVHFSFSHLAWNLVVLLGSGAWLEHVRPGWFARYILIGAPLISLALLVGEPAMSTYGGLSGLATGVIVLLALAQISPTNPARLWWMSALVLVAAKCVFDASHSSALFADFHSPAIRPSALAHAAGGATALALFLSRPGPFWPSLGRAVRPASSSVALP
jgi:rhomboid family GlyGly-CTERM serine protease